MFLPELEPLEPYTDMDFEFQLSSPYLTDHDESLADLERLLPSNAALPSFTSTAGSSDSSTGMKPEVWESERCEQLPGLLQSNWSASLPSPMACYDTGLSGNVEGIHHSSVPSSSTALNSGSHIFSVPPTPTTGTSSFFPLPYDGTRYGRHDYLGPPTPMTANSSFFPLSYDQANYGSNQFTMPPTPTTATTSFFPSAYGQPSYTSDPFSQARSHSTEELNMFSPVYGRTDVEQPLSIQSLMFHPLPVDPQRFQHFPYGYEPRVPDTSLDPCDNTSPASRILSTEHNYATVPLVADHQTTHSMPPLSESKAPEDATDRQTKAGRTTRKRGNGKCRESAASSYRTTFEARYGKAATAELDFHNMKAYEYRARYGGNKRGTLPPLYGLRKPSMKSNAPFNSRPKRVRTAVSHRPKPKTWLEKLTEGTLSPREVLKVSSNATYAEIRKAWKDLSVKYHPDKDHGNEKVATARTQAINEAFATLRDEKLRKKH
ncbi:DnaJ-domain-containing protein [Pseudovirgaria hyperparasitica]|uniref:DnaJ-domain-containing protein n=1 Tax=Pseudovirgaria hyperparasitica TaxID=470096 RepID=A0A6A6WGR2_9PEZI|nr:DnaJ-domain-containing protein [Pseudovirgaria hyperparasitica]KAF2761240.1 DnaJ-domain-containing protein [Pseudovirgaria hyperparasitica]